MIFASKKDNFRWIISGLVFILYAGISILIYVTQNDITVLYGLGTVWILLTIFIAWILPATTRYTFLEDHLLCQSMGFKRRIYYHTFSKIEASNGLYAGWKMNTAWKCLVVRYNKYDELLISPENEALFIEVFEEKKAQFAN